ncbi:MAG: hypothetical protein BWY32_03745 [bacterium ADurb.Bin243]|nr:MAG: hypothetical protein BWY32_03745 [bacterium ADurb.Bin243]
MKNKSPLNFSAIITAFACVLLYSSEALAWGALTHMGLIAEAAGKEKSSIAEEYMGAFIAGATEPDIGAMESGASSVTADYKVYHDPVFAEAMMKVAEGKKSPEREILKARAMGYLAHLKGDSVSHTAEGYSNAKEVYTSVNKGGKANHLTTELFVDTLVYAKNKKALDKYGKNFIDAQTLLEVRNEYSKIKGIEIESDVKKLNKDILKHRAAVISNETLADALAKNPDLMKQIDEEFSDRFDGLNGRGGITKSVDLIAEAFKNGDFLKIEKLKDERGLLEKTGSFAHKIVDSAAAGGLEISEKALINFTKIDYLRKKAEGLAGSKLKGNEVILAKLILNVTSGDKTTLKEALYNAEASCADLSDPAIKLKMAEVNVEILKKKVEAAYDEYKNRPWWKFWLYLTNSDRKKYEKLNAEYISKKEEFEKLKKNRTDAIAAAAAFTVPPEADANFAGSSAEIKAARQALGEAYEIYKRAGLPAEGSEFEKYKAACEAYKKIINKN